MIVVMVAPSKIPEDAGEEHDGDHDPAQPALGALHDLPGQVADEARVGEGVDDEVEAREEDEDVQVDGLGQALELPEDAAALGGGDSVAAREDEDADEAQGARDRGLGARAAVVREGEDGHRRAEEPAQGQDVLAQGGEGQADRGGGGHGQDGLGSHGGILQGAGFPPKYVPAAPSSSRAGGRPHVPR